MRDSLSFILVICSGIVIGLAVEASPSTISASVPTSLESEPDYDESLEVRAEGIPTEPVPISRYTFPEPEGISAHVPEDPVSITDYAPEEPVSNTDYAPEEPVSNTDYAPEEPVSIPRDALLEAEGIPEDAPVEPVSIPADDLVEPVSIPTDDLVEPVSITSEASAEPVNTPAEPVNTPTEGSADEPPNIPSDASESFSAESDTESAPEELKPVLTTSEPSIAVLVLSPPDPSTTAEPTTAPALEPSKSSAAAAIKVLGEVITEIGGNGLENGTIAAEGTGVYNSYSYPHSSHSHGHGGSGDYAGHGHAEEYHHEHHYVKPLKPSVVHRDPHAHYDQADAIRTQDYDRRPHQHHSHGHSQQQQRGHAYGHGHGGSNAHFQPYHYDTHKVPECAHNNRHLYNITFCLDDHYYPKETIIWAIQQSGPKARRLLSDVTYQSADNLVDGLTRAEEEGYTYAHYYGGSHDQHHALERYKPPYTGYSYSHEYYKKGGYVCPSDIYYSRPRRAMNTYGKWKVLVNVDHVPEVGHGHGHSSTSSSSGHHHHQTYTQTLRLEQCIYPDAPCSYIDSHYYSRCLQKHNFVRLVAWTYEEGLHVDTFKLPIACSCHIQQPVHYYTPQPHRVHPTTPSYGPHVHHAHHTTHTHTTPAYSHHGHGHLQGLVGLHQGKKNVVTSFLGR